MGIIHDKMRIFPPGVSGNPNGARSRKGAGLTIIGWMNHLHDLTEKELRAIARNREEPNAKRSAAIEWLDHLANAADLADFEPFITGEKTLDELRREGVPVRLAKKAKVREVTGKDGSVTITREVELSERSGQAIDRIIDRTHGKAVQPVEVRQADPNQDMTPEELIAASLADLERLTAKNN